ncbi:MAG: transcriptional regulator NrdR [Patescibacteria group bacterium]
MYCPKCKHPETSVLDSRVINDGKIIKRRRECSKCSYRFTTHEELKMLDLYVIKRNGQEVPYNKEKLKKSIEKAFNKRKVNLDMINSILEKVTDDVIALGKDSVSSEEIGNIVLNNLNVSDEAAYICYMAMFKNFATKGDFVELVKKLEKNYDQSKSVAFEK